MKAHVDLGGSETFALKGAVLVYESRNRAFAVWHDANASVDGAPYLGEAQPLTTDFVKRLSQGLGNSFVPEILPEHVLAFAPDLMIWWTPRSVRRLFFRGASGVPEGFSGQRFSQPPLVWMVREGGLFVRALRSNRRPDAATPLTIAPYWNTDGETGRVCHGSMRVPDATGVAAMPQWEQAFFQSEFTHQNGVRRLVKHPGGYFDAWMPLIDSQRAFPSSYLLPTNETLGDLLRRRH